MRIFYAHYLIKKYFHLPNEENRLSAKLSHHPNKQFEGQLERLKIDSLGKGFQKKYGESAIKVFFLNFFV